MVGFSHIYFFNLFLYVRYKPATVTVTSELPLGAGLGSSAAFCVALSGALLALSECCELDYSQQGWLTLRNSELDLVNKWAFEGEKIIHGRPSGIDNTVSTYGMSAYSIDSWNADLPYMYTYVFSVGSFLLSLSFEEGGEEHKSAGMRQSTIYFSN